MNDVERVVSLAPSATSTLTAMGAADLLVGVTAHCEPGKDVPVVGGWLNVDTDRVGSLEPDVVLTSDALQAEIRDELRERGLRVRHAEPARLDDVLRGSEELARAVGRPDEGARLRATLEARLETVREAVDGRERPVVYCEEWSDPPMAAGNWVPDAVEAAGGRYPFVPAGERSREVDRSTVEVADPAYVVLHVCGRGDRVDPDAVHERGWELDAEVTVFDDSLLNQPSPRLVEGVERLASVLHGYRPPDSGRFR